MQYPNYISIDATGSLVKKLKLPNGELSSHIYLYQIVCETPTAKMPVFQMLSAAQHTNAILYWLFEIRRIGSLHKTSFPRPQQIVCDFDRALMGAIVRAFGNCNDLKEYLSICFLSIVNKNEKIPTCFLRLDISHYVSFITRWKIFTSVHPKVKTFYIIIMCLLTRTTDFTVLQQIVRAAIILCSSENVGKDENQRDTLAEKSRILLCNKIRGVPDIDEIADRGTEIGRDVDELDLLLTDINQGDIYQNSGKLNSTDNNAMIAWVNTFFDSCVNDLRNALEGVDINPYYCPAMVQKIKYLLPYFPLYSGVMISKFGFGKINASSSAVESEFNDIKHRLLKYSSQSMRIDRFLTVHIQSFSGKAKLAMSEINRPVFPSTSNTNTHHKSPIQVSTEAVTYPKLDTKLSVNSDESDQEPCELAAEQNWRNKNDKKTKRVYLDACHGWDTFNINKKHITLGVLQNGNISPVLKVGASNIIVKNTCGFDSIMHILAVACVYDKFKATVDTATTEAFKFIKSFVQLGPTKNIYKMRAEILKSVTCFIQATVTPDIVTIDALSNVVNLCEYVFPESYSYIEICTCQTCGNIKIVKKCILPINEEILNKHGYAKIVDAIKEGKVLKLRCSKCDEKRSRNLSYGAQLFIESSIITALDDIPLSIQLNEQHYTHVGCVVYHGQNSQTSVGHYTAYVRNGTN